VLVGPPNSGKSTLFNRLVGRSAALVSSEAGTTRDWVSQWIELDGMPVQLFDTAGLGRSADAMANAAVEAGRSLLARCDLQIIVIDGSEPLTGRTDLPSLHPPEDIVALVVVNKADLEQAWSLTDLQDSLPAAELRPVRVSGKEETGIGQLAARALAALGIDDLEPAHPTLFTCRQYAAAEEIIARLDDRLKVTPDIIRHKLIQCDW
jgi:tRNA modification GTPase